MRIACKSSGRQKYTREKSTRENSTRVEFRRKLTACNFVGNRRKGTKREGDGQPRRIFFQVHGSHLLVSPLISLTLKQFERFTILHNASSNEFSVFLVIFVFFKCSSVKKLRLTRKYSVSHLFPIVKLSCFSI